MTSAQDRWVLAATAFAESAWLFAVFGIVGVATLGTGSPLSWVAVLAVIVSSLVVSRALQAIIMPNEAAYATQMVLGAAVIYLTVAIEATPYVAGLDLWWVGHTSLEQAADEYWLRPAVATAMGVALWWRGGRLAASDAPDETLLLSFKLGVVALAVAVVVDAAQPADLNVYQVLFVFIASALAGLAVSHLSTPSTEAARRGTWPRIIGGVVSGVLLIGLVFGLVQNTLLPFVSRLLQSAAGLLADYVVGPVISVVVTPIVYVFEVVIRALLRLFQTDVEQQPSEGLGLPSDVQQEIQEQAADRWVSPAVEVLGWILLAVLVVAGLLLLARAYRRRRRRRWLQSDGTRESVRADADPLSDVAKLLLGLLPERFRRGRRGAGREVPEGEPGVVEAFRLYYRLLALAEGGGVTRSPSVSPTEFQAALETILPRNLVRLATSVFNGACYGHHPASDAQLGEIRASLEQATAAS